MTVLLATRRALPAEGWERWCVVPAGPAPDLPAESRLPGLAARLERAYDAVVPDWLAQAARLGAAPSARFAHTPTAAGNVSDFGLMLAWTRLVEEWAAQSERILVVCDDPWLFRHLAGRPGIVAGPPPPLAVAALRLAVRGILARLKVSLAACRAALATRARPVATGAPALLVYGHPGSNAQGDDAYFGDLMRRFPRLTRALHVDCPPARAAQLAADGRTVALHGFGSPLFALTLWRFCWKPDGADWLVRRAAAREGGTGTPAMIAWQLHCQRRWLAAARPAVVAWPWENHAWERDFVRACRDAKVATLGYQHATVGHREWNYSAASNPDGVASLPDRVLCVGAADRDRLTRLGCPPGRLAIGGALRYAAPAAPPFDAAAPVFVALPFDAAVAAEMVAALRPLAAAGRRFVVKDHPLSPFRFEPAPGLERTDRGLGAQPAVSAVLYCITTVGLEAVLAGVPTLRFVPAARPVVDVMPDGIALPAADADGLGAALAVLPPPPAVARAQVFADPDPALWQQVLAA